jgi:hypothetical protein
MDSPDYTREDVKQEAKRILKEAIRYIDGETVKPVPISNHAAVMTMVADATGVYDGW